MVPEAEDSALELHGWHRQAGPELSPVRTDQEDFRQPPCQGYAQRMPEAWYRGARGTLLDREGRGSQASEGGGWEET